MVDALRRTRDLVRPDGLVIDIRPTPEPAVVEVRGHGAVERAGVMGESGSGQEYRDADRALAEAIARGWFIIDAERHFHFERHAPSAAALQQHIEDTWGSEAWLDPVTLERVAQACLRIGAGAQVVLVEDVGIRRLVPGP